MSYQGANVVPYEVQVETWLKILQRLVTPSIEQMVLIVKTGAEDFCWKNGGEIKETYRHALEAVLESRDDQLTAKIDKDVQSIRDVLHAFVRSYAAMISHNTETDCTQAIVIPRVAEWYRRVVTAVFMQLLDPEMVDVRNMSMRQTLRDWIDRMVRDEAEQIVPIQAFSPKVQQQPEPEKKPKKKKKVRFVVDSEDESEEDEEEEKVERKEEEEEEPQKKKKEEEEEEPTVIQVEKELMPVDQPPEASVHPVEEAAPAPVLSIPLQQQQVAADQASLQQQQQQQPVAADQVPSVSLI